MIKIVLLLIAALSYVPANAAETLLVETNGVFPGVAEQAFASAGFNVVSDGANPGSGFYVSVTSDNPNDVLYTSGGMPYGSWRNNFIIGYVCFIKKNPVVLFGTSTYTQVSAAGPLTANATAGVRNSLLGGVERAVERLRRPEILALKTQCSSISKSAK